ncbi:conserved hypothetical protein [Pediculus humanus corporis]|uniref:Phosphate transporter n=1 Tax=Pediculus humanus subsp. corporis TaxID=121224 RepID=E0VWN3_PEDHC|nr:uncharacterized protein Phum_PHUM489280 [Pediculus humanus corporis]EEB17789.1 conserved hypothetical protein [Pediculus humanus corporis]
MDAITTYTIEKYSPELLWIVIVGFLVAFILAFGIGANDVANSFGTSVGSKVLTIRQACILATIFEILGAVLIGYKVSDTVRKGIFDLTMYRNCEKELMLGFLSSLFGSAALLIGATFFKMPVSGTHSVVGSTVGFSLVLKGFQGISWNTLLTIVASWFVSPVLSGTISVVLFLVIRKFILQTSNPLKHSVRSLPFFYGFTIFINVFSIIHDGPELLYMHDIELWVVLTVSVALGILTGLAVQFFFAPYLKKKILLESDPMKLQPGSKVNFSCGDTDESSRESSPQKSRPVSIIVEQEKNNSVMAKELSDFSKTNSDVALQQNGKTKNFQSFFRKGILRIKGENCLDQRDHTQKYTTKPSFTVGETNLGVNMNPNLGSNSLPSSGQVTPSTGLTPNSSAVPLVRSKDTKHVNSVSPAEDKAISQDDPPEVSRLFSFLQILTATFGSFAHGGNDVSNAIGPLIALFLIYTNGEVDSKAQTPIYILLYGGIGISIGLWLWGRRVIETIGEDLTKITASTGFTIEIGAAFTVLMASKIGLPISTTHCKVGSVVFVGWASSSKSGVDWKVFRNIISAWVITVPLSAGLSAAFMAFFRAVAT